MKERTMILDVTTKNVPTQIHPPVTEQPPVGIPPTAVVFGNDHNNNSNNGRDPLFPVVLHRMLTAVEEEGLSHIISWQPHGRSLKVHQPSLFVEKILVRWFRQSKWSSFQRQLNIYGFKRITCGLDTNAYYHPRFLRGHEDLAHYIPRMHIKRTGPRRPSASYDEPDFYKMRPLSSPPPALVYPTHPLVDPIPGPNVGTCAPSAVIARAENTPVPSARDILMSLTSANHHGIASGITAAAASNIPNRDLLEAWTTTTMQRNMGSTMHAVGASNFVTPSVARHPLPTSLMEVPVQAVLGRPSNRNTVDTTLSTGSWKRALIAELLFAAPRLQSSTASAGLSSIDRALFLQLEKSRQRQQELEAAAVRVSRISMPPPAISPSQRLDQLLRGDASSLPHQILELSLLSEHLRGRTLQM